MSVDSVVVLKFTCTVSTSIHVGFTLVALTLDQVTSVPWSIHHDSHSIFWILQQPFQTQIKLARQAVVQQRGARDLFLSCLCVLGGRGDSRNLQDGANMYILCEVIPHTILLRIQPNHVLSLHDAQIRGRATLEI